MAFTAIIPGEVVGQEGEVYIAYPSFAERLHFPKLESTYGGLKDFRYYAADQSAPVKFIWLRVAEIVRREMSDDGKEIVTCARYSYA